MENLDALALAQKVKDKDLSPKELVEWGIKQIEGLNPYVNAVTSKRYDKALAEAETRDFSGQPFGGVPLLLKDLGQEQLGEPANSGSKLFTNYRARISDNFVRALESLGFIVLGRTNVPEFGFKNISDSQQYGAVNLPFDRSRNAGGSSGGAAAAVSSGMLPLATASDGGGSIRIPASFNGLIGLKPSRGRMPVGPIGFRGWQGLSSHFALTKSVRDTRALLAGMQVCQLESPFVLPLLSSRQLESPLRKKLRIGVQMTSPVGTPVSKDAQAAVKRACQFLTDQGHQVSEVSALPLDGWEAIKTYYLMNSVETAAMFDEISVQLGRSMTIADMELMTWALYQSGQKVAAKDYTKAIQKWDTYSHVMAEYHQEFDLLLSPATADVAPKHGQLQLDEDLREKLLHISDYGVSEQQDLLLEMFKPGLSLTPFNQLANQTGQPSISLPLYQTTAGLPLGVQFTAAKGREDLLLALAQDFETAGQFVQPRPVFERKEDV
ncbi:amidase [Streptococcus cuniculipharyngis]|uniref:Amidase n=1 Tax=Streptococcus cuniculipharyngis TaxID=1562651 RepID=A0A5C5S9A6_9STRE|nr:amidase [Streptococcus cuniculipharyngis]TWS96945.1 amidase [Streptococcus cuniculipharyngis]